MHRNIAKYVVVRSVTTAFADHRSPVNSTWTTTTSYQCLDTPSTTWVWNTVLFLLSMTFITIPTDNFLFCHPALLFLLYSYHRRAHRMWRRCCLLGGCSIPGFESRRTHYHRLVLTGGLRPQPLARTTYQNRRWLTALVHPPRRGPSDRRRGERQGAS